MNSTASPEIAIIMSVYLNDCLTCVNAAISSLLEQSFPHFDCFIQIDGPLNPDVKDYLYGLQDARIQLLSREENLGLARSLNGLLAVVLEKGYPFIARMDADDICFPTRLEKQMHYLEEHSDIDCLGTWAIEIDGEGKEFFRKRMPETHEECLDLFRKRDCVIHPTVMFRKSFFEKAGLYPTDTYFAEDTLLWAQGFSAGCRFANLTEYLLYYRLDDSFFKRRRGWKHARSIFSLRRRINRMLGFGLREDLYGLAYAFVKLMPPPVLNILYRVAR